MSRHVVHIEQGEVNTGGGYVPERRDGYITLERTTERVAYGAERVKRNHPKRTEY